MKFSHGIFIFTLALFTWPLSYFINFDTASAIIFLVIILVLILLNRDKVDVQKLLFPVFYMVMYRTKIGLKFMDSFAKKCRETIKFVSLCFIGIGFLAMAYISAMMLVFTFNLFQKPAETSQGVSLVLPFTNIPGVGYLSFWHFLIGLFIVIVLHEGAHGVVARAHKEKIKSSGFALFAFFIPILPAAFVEPDEKKLVKADPIAQYSIFAAGPVINLIIAYLLIMAFPYVTGAGLAPFEGSITEPVGISFATAQEGLPMANAGINSGTIITSVNGKKIASTEDFVESSYYIRPNQIVEIGTNNGTFTVTTAEYPDGSSPKGYFGMAGIQNERRIKKGLESFAAGFYWVKGLIKWIFIFNFFLGLMNLLPIFITDGGRMMSLALSQTIKDKKKAAKINAFIGAVFLVALLTPLLIRYFIAPFFGMN